MASVPTQIEAGARAVLDFWLQDALEHDWPTQELDKLWFGGGAALDAQIDARFGEQVREAVGGGLRTWEARPLDRLALVILLDQFTRNIFRGKADAFAGDARAQSLVVDGLTLGWDLQLPLAGRVFFYTPLEHAESLELQDAGVACFERLRDSAPPERLRDIQSFLDYALQHRAIIARFGRFPHRNAVLRRADTEQEREFLRNGPRFGQ